MRKVAFIIPPTVELLDLAGPVQVFTEAKFYGFDIETDFFIYERNPVSTCGLVFGKIMDYTKAQLSEGDFVFIPGMDHHYIQSKSFRDNERFFNWLRSCHEKKIRVCSVCNGAFALGEAGLLDGVKCTTHWRRVNELQKRFPKAKVVDDVLYVNNDFVSTSAGISAGVDLALSILEDLAGVYFAHKVARGLVFYHRTNGEGRQQRNYYDFRNHLNVKIHEIQDYLFHNIDGNVSIDHLATIAGMSPRNLTRTFKETTGSTITEYLTQIRLDTAKYLLRNSNQSMAAIAAKCGFKTQRQLQRIIRNSKETS